MNLTIELPEDLAVALQGIASDHKTSIQQLALNGLRSLASDHPALCSARTIGSPAGLLALIREPSNLLPADVDALDDAIAKGRLPVRVSNLF
jgi:hypothetical protein